jgi:hypothetical protein
MGARPIHAREGCGSFAKAPYPPLDGDDSVAQQGACEGVHDRGFSPVP